MFTVDEDCDECTPRLYERSFSQQPILAVASSSVPFFFTFVLVSIAVLCRVFPFLIGKQQQHYEPNTFGRRIAALSFSTTIGLATVLAELILCEIANTLNPAARTIALKTTVPTLLFLLIVLIPFLEIQSFLRGAGWDFGRSIKGTIPKLPWLLQLLGFVGWIICFWWLGRGLPGSHVHDISSKNTSSLINACLERIGVIGVSLMALLSGFASISSPWQSFGARSRVVTESDIARKQTGLDATNDLLVAKKSRLRAVQRKLLENRQDGFMIKVMGTIRGNVNAQEVKALEMEVSGLETMALSLSSSLSMLQTRRAASQRAASRWGKAMTVPNHIFSIYCLYRILATTVASLRRWLSSGATFSNSDPINRFLGLLAKHWDPTLDQAAWSRQISFLLSGVILLASFNSVLQTFHLFTRLMPGLLYQTQANLALLVGQVSATYVISSALLLRSNLPREVGSAISEVLGTPLDGLFVEGWFEGWFLFGSLATALGIWVERHLGAAERDLRDEWDDCDGDIENGHKRS
ncbi:MAG: hypothetical protein M1818_004731 [Claussenomyces sp. TS43310]|nr:MAG: hypothetical protein M1818_004731 [Claussenomyces sp. TS43310]